MRFERLFLLCLCTGLSASSCSSDSTKSAPPASVESTQAVAPLKPEAVVQQFLRWYSNPRQEALNSLPLVPASLTDDGDTTDIYKVDFKAAEQYISPFRASGFVSDNYLANELSVIQAADSLMQAERQWAGPPLGLNYDRVVFSQDPQADLEKLIRTKPTVTIRKDTARVFFAQLPKPEDMREGADLEFLLVWQQSKWLIERIRPIFKP
jgi:hypothetical protein